MNTYTYTVTVEAETEAQARQVMAERIYHDEDIYTDADGNEYADAFPYSIYFAQD